MWMFVRWRVFHIELILFWSSLHGFYMESNIVWCLWKRCTWKMIQYEIVHDLMIWGLQMSFAFYFLKYNFNDRWKYFVIIFIYVKMNACEHLCRWDHLVPCSSQTTVAMTINTNINTEHICSLHMKQVQLVQVDRHTNKQWTWICP